jgi:dipeptidase E
MTCIHSIRRLLLISNSTLHGSAYLDHAEKEIQAFVDGGSGVVFVPYALHGRRAYATKAQDRFRDMGLSLVSIHYVSNMTRAVEEADVIFVGWRQHVQALAGTP